ncbi:MAG: glycosyl hydrolase 115 family protein, partial [Prevotellaceae bacterium]|nr:glycosyl hydrolase 115 family protein [Prevotellaceae bacterium]
MKILRSLLLLFALNLISASLTFSANGSLLLKKGRLQIVSSPNESKAIRIALGNLKSDLNKVLNDDTPIEKSIKEGYNGVQIVVVNASTANKKTLADLKPLNGFESHRVYVNAKNNMVYLVGADDRGTIYAMYTFCEEILGVPPLWFFSSWQANKKDAIEISADFNYYAPSPQVRYRTWFPNDQDLLKPWETQSPKNMEYWMEAMMRLKLNSIELEQTVRNN